MENLTELDVKKMRLRYETLFENKTYEEAVKALELTEGKDKDDEKHPFWGKTKKEEKEGKEEESDDDDDDDEDEDEEEEDSKDKKAKNKAGAYKKNDKSAKSKKSKNKMGSMDVDMSAGDMPSNMAKNAKDSKAKSYSKNEALQGHKPGQFQTVVECKCGSRNLKLSEQKSMIKCKRCGYTDLVENVYGFKAVMTYNKIVEESKKSK